MRTHSILKRLLAAFLLLALVMAVYVLWARPYQLRWGATEEEAKRPMPGDKLAPDPTFLATRAIKIAGTPEAIWPWLIQMGYGRAGYYGFDILENLGSPLGIRSADRVLPEFQHFAVGDEVPISPFARMVFRAIEPNRYLIWAGMTADYPSSFTWALYPLDRSHTRLVSRIRWHYHWNIPELSRPRTVYGIRGSCCDQEDLVGRQGPGRGADRDDDTPVRRIHHPCRLGIGIPFDIGDALVAASHCATMANRIDRRSYLAHRLVFTDSLRRVNLRSNPRYVLLPVGYVTGPQNESLIGRPMNLES